MYRTRSSIEDGSKSSRSVFAGVFVFLRLDRQSWKKDKAAINIDPAAKTTSLLFIYFYIQKNLKLNQILAVCEENDAADNNLKVISKGIKIK